MSALDYLAPWMADRTIHAVRPLELAAGPSVVTGDDLRKWRRGRGWKQADAASALGVSQSRISRAEALGNEAIPLDLAASIRLAH